MKTHIAHQVKQQLKNYISRHATFWTSRNCMGPLKDENKLQVDEKNNKNWKTFENV